MDFSKVLTAHLLKQCLGRWSQMRSAAAPSWGIDCLLNTWLRVSDRRWQHRIEAVCASSLPWALGQGSADDFLADVLFSLTCAEVLCCEGSAVLAVRISLSFFIDVQWLRSRGRIFRAMFALSLSFLLALLFLHSAKRRTHSDADRFTNNTNAQTLLSTLSHTISGRQSAQRVLTVSPQWRMTTALELLQCM